MTIHVLFLCTGNSARSIIAEALLNRLGRGRFQAYSAGSEPAGQLNPGAIDILKQKGFDASTLRSKSWEEFAGEDAPAINLIFTVCDSAASETCPVWPGHPLTIHWGIPDPAAVAGGENVKKAFQDTWATLESRLEKLVGLPVEDMNSDETKTALRAIADSQ